MWVLCSLKGLYTWQTIAKHQWFLVSWMIKCLRFILKRLSTNKCEIHDTMEGHYCCFARGDILTLCSAVGARLTALPKKCQYKKRVRVHAGAKTARSSVFVVLLTENVHEMQCLIKAETCQKKCLCLKCGTSPSINHIFPWARAKPHFTEVSPDGFAIPC